MSFSRAMRVLCLRKQQVHWFGVSPEPDVKFGKPNDQSINQPPTVENTLTNSAIDSAEMPCFNFRFELILWKVT